MSGDMANFTRLPREIGQERAFGLLETAMEQARKAVEGEGGQIVDTAGDGFLAIFGAPLAFEDASLRACRAALTFRDRIAAGRDGFVAEFGAAAEFRVGLSGGTAMFVRYDDGGAKVLGDPVNLAARLQASAGLGEVLIGEDIHRECEGFVTVEDRGAADFKGFDWPVAHYALTGIRAETERFSGARRRGLTRLASRSDEIAAVRRALDRTGRRVVAITGVAGVGKSRLVHEALQVMPRRDQVVYGQCVAEGRAYGPIFDILRHAAKADRGLSHFETLRRLSEVFPFVLDMAEVSALFSGDPSGEDSRNRALRTRDFLGGVLARLSATGAHVMVVEDIHWIDPGSSAVLEALLPLRPTLIVTRRPAPPIAWLDSPHIARIELGLLDAAAIGEIVRDSYGAKLAEDTAALIVDKSEGLPLVAEEMVRALRARDSAATGDADLLTGTLEQSVLSRCDRLEPAARRVLSIAAAIGRDFSVDLLTRAAGSAPDIEAMMSADLIEQVQGDHWRFHHALIRDAVYSGMLSGARREAHRAIAIALEAQAGEGGADRGRIGRHFAEADNHVKAARYLALGAADALAQYDLINAESLAARAMGYVARDPTVLDEAGYRALVITWLHSLHHLAEFRRIVDLSRQLLPRLQAAGASTELSIVQTLVALSMTHTREYAGGETLAQETLEQSERVGDRLGAAWARVALLRNFEETGKRSVAELESLADAILPVAEAEGDRALSMIALYQLCAVYRTAGRRGQSVATANRLMAFAVEHDDRRGHAFASWAKALIHIIDDAPERALATVREGRRHALGGSGDEATCRAIELYSRTMIAASHALAEEIAGFTAEVRRRGDYNLIHAMCWIAAVLHLRKGALADGWRRLNRDLPEVALAGNQPMERQFRLLKAEVLLAVAGLVEPRASEDGQAKEPRRRGPRDLLTFLRLRPWALRDATIELKRCLELEPEAAGANYARARIGLGLVALRRRDKATARAHLEAGRDAAMADGVDLLVRRARAALKQL
ncbi:ATP-binding protein [Litorisediminicola beolgyonensis]|uniref:ATP-binding protein n=1 Tax=Litorisediminicola beolgyonensis TaxID=1173614 RepID=A0ABW3ZK14_9RHOB